MTNSNTSVNTIAPLTNVARFTELVDGLVNRPPALPGFGVYYGKSGLGKTFSALYAINSFRAHYVECDSTWTQKAFCAHVMLEIGLLPPGTPLCQPIWVATAAIGAYFADNPKRPLIIDEADILVKRRMIEVVRAIYKHCADAGASIVLIGEENMPHALKMWERVDSRVLKSTRAEPLTQEDILILTGMICPGIEIDAALLIRLRQTTGGSARRVVGKLYGLKEFCGQRGLTSATLDAWNPAEAA